MAYVLGFDKLRAVDSSVTAAATAVEKAEASYREGAIDYGRVYVLQTELLKQQIAAVQTKAEIVRNLIVVFQALGGGWQCTPDVASGTAHVLPSSVGVPIQSIIDPSGFRGF